MNRTTRSVSLTQAGTALLEAVAPAFAALSQGVEAARTAGEAPAGLLRVTMSYVAFSTLFEPHLRGFFAAYPAVTLDLSIDSRPSDIVDKGFDAGVRPGRTVQQDMVAVAIGPLQKLVVVGAPAYFASAGRPKRPEDLLRHDCVRQRVSSEGTLLAWALRTGKQRLTLDVKGSLVLDDMRSVVDAVRAGNGLGYVFEQFIGQDLASGRLERVLPEHALVREAFFLYYPSRRRLPRKLRVFSDWFRDKNA